MRPTTISITATAGRNRGLSLEFRVKSLVFRDALRVIERNEAI